MQDKINLLSGKKATVSMIPITIDPELKKRWQPATLGCIQCEVTVTQSCEALLSEIDSLCQQLCDTMTIEQIKQKPHIAQTRACCAALGKDVQRYRNSAEAMHRRILQGKGLYHINNVVETNNLVSVRSGYSLGSYDLDKLQGPVCWSVTGQGVHYQGIGKDAVNIEFLPVLKDELGWFGNPNSDSTRAMITEQTHRLLLCVFGVDGTSDLAAVLDDAERALKEYCSAVNIERKIIEG